MDWISDQVAIGNFVGAHVMPPAFDAILSLKPDCCDEDRVDVDVLCIPLIDGHGNRKDTVLLLQQDNVFLCIATQSGYAQYAW